MILLNFFNCAGFIVFFLCVFGLLLHAPFALYLKYCRRPEKKSSSFATKENQDIFHVIQLPVYNENPAVVASLLDSTCLIDYPREKFCIQLLDDSSIPGISSELKEFVAEINKEHQDLQLTYLHRDYRKDYKAGNINFGLEQLNLGVSSTASQDSNHVVISIFDADFLIPSEYLKKISRHFTSPEIGIVQSNTFFRNSNVNVLTKAQTVFQDNLQNAEFSARSRNNHLSTFRGSAGSIRLSVIEECGYWQGDTQIEDVDLSFLAQSLGWRVVYDDSVVCGSLLPESYNEYKLQQRSWMKGLMEVMRKRIRQVLCTKKLSFTQKLGGLDFFFILSLQALYMIGAHLSLIPAYNFWCLFASPAPLNIIFSCFVFLLILTHIPLFIHNPYAHAFEHGAQDPKNKFWQMIFSFSLMTAMFCTFTVGLLEGLSGRKVHRHRTGKGDQHQGERSDSELPKSSVDILRRINMFEMLIATYSICFVAWAIHHHEYFIGGVYTILAIVYPVNAVVSFRELRNMQNR